MWLRLLLCVVIIMSVTRYVTSQNCVPDYCPSSTVEAAYVPADLSGDYFFIGGIFGVHESGGSPYKCGGPRKRGVQNLEAFLWAVQHFREFYSSLLSSVSIGAVGLDSCTSPERATQQVLNLETCAVGYRPPNQQAILPADLLGWIGADTSEQAMQMAPMMADMKKTLISPAATSPVLSEAGSYPYFIRTVPSDLEQAAAMAALLDTQGWNYIQLLYSNDTYGLTGRSELLRQMAPFNTCVVYEEAIPGGATGDDMEQIVEHLLERAVTRVVVVFADEDTSRALLQAAARFGTRGTFTWVGTNAWAREYEVTNGVQTTAEGAVTMGLNQYALGFEQFKDYWSRLKPEDNTANPWFAEYWMDTFDCSLPGTQSTAPACDTAAQRLSADDLDDFVPYTLKAVYALLNAIDEARRSVCLGNAGLCSEFIDYAGRWDIIQHKAINLNLPGLNFDPNTGDPVATRHDVINFRAPHDNCATHCYVNIGFHDAGSVGVAYTSDVLTYDDNGDRVSDATSVCPDNPCLVCGETAAGGGGAVSPSGTSTTTISYEPSSPERKVELREDTWAIALLILAALGVLFVLAIEIYLLAMVVGTSNHGNSPWRNMWLGQVLLFGVLLCYLTLFAFVPTATDATCGIIRFGVGASYALCFSVLLVKLMILLSSKTVGSLGGIFQVLMLFFAWMIQIAIDVQWMILKPPAAIFDPERGMVCQESFTNHVLSLVYVMFLILITTFISIKAHGIGTNFREGVFIGLTCGFSIPVWIAWILLGKLNSNADFELPAMAFGLFITATLIMLIMFCPKVRQLSSMGVEGIYNQSSPGYTPSVIAASAVRGPGSVVGSVAHSQGKAPSIILGPPSLIGKPLYIDGDRIVTNEQPRPRAIPRHLQSDPKRPTSDPQPHQPAGAENALYLRHPGARSSYNGSLHSAPGANGSSHQPHQQHQGASSRVLRVTGDLAGRRYMDNSKPPSEVGAYQNGGHRTNTMRSNRSNRSSGSFKVHRSFTDLGSL